MTIYYADLDGGSCGETRIDAESLDEAWTVALEWARDGWDSDTDADGWYTSVHAELAVRSDDEERRESIEVVSDEDLDTLCPPCPAGEAHEWEGVGGCDENPGITSPGGVAIAHYRRCVACGLDEESVSDDLATVSAGEATYRVRWTRESRWIAYEDDVEAGEVEAESATEALAKALEGVDPTRYRTDRTYWIDVYVRPASDPDDYTRGAAEVVRIDPRVPACREGAWDVDRALEALGRPDTEEEDGHLWADWGTVGCGATVIHSTGCVRCGLGRDDAKTPGKIGPVEYRSYIEDEYSLELSEAVAPC